jgi:hypothetical protein
MISVECPSKSHVLSNVPPVSDVLQPLSPCRATLLLEAIFDNAKMSASFSFKVLKKEGEAHHIGYCPVASSDLDLFWGQILLQVEVLQPIG